MKKLICLAGFIGIVASVHADWLLWTVASTDYASVEGLKSGDVVGARIGYVTAGQDAGYNGTTIMKNYSLDQRFFDTEGEMDIGDKQMVDLSQISGVASYSFYVELLNEGGEAIARTAAGSGNTYMTYSQLSGYIASASVGSVPQASVWHGGTFEAVPEPSSMALLALGAGLVGLRRKLRKGKKGKRA